jgi:apolipoprotein N-acyltransferase
MVRMIFSRWLLPATSGLLLVFAFPPFDVIQSAWVGLVPLLYALQHCRPGEAFRRGYVAGLVFFGGTIWWVAHVSLFGMVASVAFLALYFGAAAVWFGMVERALGLPARAAGAPAAEPSPAAAASLGVWRQSRQAAPADPAETLPVAMRNILVGLVASAGWVTLEWVRGVFLLGGFPWNFLGASQSRAVPMIQCAAVVGVYGVSAMLCFVNFGLFHTSRRFLRYMFQQQPIRRLSWEFYAAMLLIGLAFIYGVRAIRAPGQERLVRIALVQPNISQTLKFDPAELPLMLERYRTLSAEALAHQPDLIIWPETAIPSQLRPDSEFVQLARTMAARGNAHLLTGAFDVEARNDTLDYFNAAALFRPDGSVAGLYRKIHLVPFGEYVPWRRVLPFMKWLTPISDSLEPGRDHTVFEIGRMEAPEDADPKSATHPAVQSSAAGRGARFSVVICFEDTVPGLYRQFVRRDVDFMVNLTNDAWFKESPAAAMHLANAVFRAVETRRPLVRATNNGVTAVVDQFGFVRRQLPPFTADLMIYELRLPLAPATTVYTARGDLFVAGCALVTAMASLLICGRGIRRKPAS